MTIIRWLIVSLIVVASCSIGRCDDLVGQASMATRWKFMERVSDCVDAPESTQLCRGDDSLQYRCGAKAANDLDAFIDRRPVSCVPFSLDQYGRTVASCAVGGVDIEEWLVRSGLALDWPRYSWRQYDAAQRDAERAGRGIWSDSYVGPRLYRACIRANRR